MFIIFIILTLSVISYLAIENSFIFAYVKKKKKVGLHTVDK